MLAIANIPKKVGWRNLILFLTRVGFEPTSEDCGKDEYAPEHSALDHSAISPNTFLSFFASIGTRLVIFTIDAGPRSPLRADLWTSTRSVCLVVVPVVILCLVLDYHYNLHSCRYYKMPPRAARAASPAEGEANKRKESTGTS